jgi:hypothetical protein
MGGFCVSRGVYQRAVHASHVLVPASPRQEQLDRSASRLDSRVVGVSCPQVRAEWGLVCVTKAQCYSAVHNYVVMHMSVFTLAPPLQLEYKNAT